MLARELRAIGAASGIALGALKEVPGGVEFSCDAAALAGLQLRTRVASRVVVRIAAFRATAFHELERAAKKVEWARFLAPGAPFRLRVTCRKSRLYHSDAVAERVAGAITHGVKGAAWAEGKEKDDDADDAAEPGDQDAAQLFVVRFDHDRCTISADASGALLHRRGYRQAVARAPLRETIAAAMLLGAEWDPATPLIDPMCGSGTIAIEAAMLARRIAPGLGRAFAAERWPETPAKVWSEARKAAKAESIERAPARILASDRDEGAITAARANAERAGVAADIEFRVAALSALEAPRSAGLLLANPPYGIRVGEAKPLRDLFARLGQLARTKLPGWRIALLSGNKELDAQVKLKWTECFKTKNGGIPVRLIRATIPANSAAL